MTADQPVIPLFYCLMPDKNNEDSLAESLLDSGLNDAFICLRLRGRIQAWVFTNVK